MPIDPDKTKSVIDTLKKMSSKELAVTIFLMVGAVSAAFWVENRYAKIEETRAAIEKAEMDIRKHKDEIIQMHVRTFELLKAQPKPIRDQIEKNSNDFMENYRRLQTDKK